MIFPIFEFSVDLTAPDDLNTSQLSSSIQKRKVRPALIADDDNDEDIEAVKAKPKKKEKPKLKSVDIDEMGSREHLKTKQQIEDLRKEHGDKWLHEKCASKVQEVMGMQVQSDQKTTEEKLEDIFGLNDIAAINRNQTSTPVQELGPNAQSTSTSSHLDVRIFLILIKLCHFVSYLNLIVYFFRQQQFYSAESSKNDFKSIANSEDSSTTLKSAENVRMDESMESMEKTMFRSVHENLTNLYSTTENEPEQLSDSEENETIYLVTNQSNKNMQILLIVSDQSIREKNDMTGKTINKWTMTMLESCERISSDVVRIRFDTIKRDKRERVYQLEKDEGRKLDDFLRNVLAQRPLSDIITIFRCITCTLQFSLEKLPRKNGKRFAFKV